MESIKNNLAIFQEGIDNKPIIFIHGFPFDHLMWKDQIDFLKDEYFCISYDIRGLGSSPAGDGQFTMEMFVDDLEAIVDSLDEKPVVCGLSMGGYILFRAVERFEEKLKGVIFCDTKAKADDNDGKLKRAEAIKLINEKGVHVFVEEFLANLFLTENLREEFFTDILERSRKFSPLGVKGCLLAMAGRSDAADYLSKIKIPALLLCGEDDMLTTPEIMKQIADEIKGSDFHIVPNSAHMVPIENPNFVNKKIKEFLKHIL